MEGKYASILDTLSTYAFTSVIELQVWPKINKSKNVRSFGKFIGISEKIYLEMEGAKIECNMTKMHHKFIMNSSIFYEVLGEIVYFIPNPNIRLMEFFIHILPRQHQT